MKNVFIIYLSNDGLNYLGASNIKALYQLIINLDNYKPVSINNKKFSYNNLLNTIRVSQNNNKLYVAYIDCNDGAEIRILEIGVVSK